MPRKIANFRGEALRRGSALAAMLLAAMLLAGMGAANAEAAAKTYVWYDKDGRPHYTDRPHTGSEEVALTPAQTYSTPPQARTSTRAAPPAANGSTAPGSACRMISPTPDEVILNQPSITVTALGPQRATAVLRLNGATINSIDGQPVFTVTPIPRGTYTAAVLFTGMTGATVCQTPTVTFHVRQPSVVNPAIPKPAPKPKPKA